MNSHFVAGCPEFSLPLPSSSERANNEAKPDDKRLNASHKSGNEKMIEKRDILEVPDD